MNKLSRSEPGRVVPTYESILLAGWEDVYRKSQLSLLILLALKDGPKYLAQISQFITEVSKGLQTTDEQSMYRTLRRFTAADMVQSQEMPGTAGPKRKLYALSDTGAVVLADFLRRNVIDFFYKPTVRTLIERK
jgi:PadR family transcriptional regulator PadR